MGESRGKRERDAFNCTSEKKTKHAVICYTRDKSNSKGKTRKKRDASNCASERRAKDSVICSTRDRQTFEKQKKKKRKNQQKEKPPTVLRTKARKTRRFVRQETVGLARKKWGGTSKREGGREREGEIQLTVRR